MDWKSRNSVPCRGSGTSCPLSQALIMLGRGEMSERICRARTVTENSDHITLFEKAPLGGMAEPSRRSRTKPPNKQPQVAPQPRSGSIAHGGDRETRLLEIKELSSLRGSGRRFAYRTCPFPFTIYLYEQSSSNPIGPRACNFCVEMPISQPFPNSSPSVKRVDALI